MGRNDDWEFWRKNLQKKFSGHPLEVIQWEATRRCDLDCKHCGSPKEKVCLQDELSTEEAIKAFTQIHDTFKLSSPEFYVTLTGGEPFLREDMWKILALFHSFGWISTIQTNGNYLARYPEEISRLYQLGVRAVGLDLDGMPEYHDYLRGKRGHWAQTAELLGKILYFSFATQDFFTTVTTVVTLENINSLPAFWVIIKALNPHRWRLLPIEQVGRASERLSLTGAEYLKLFDFIRGIRLEQIDNPKFVQPELGCIGWLGKRWEGVVRPYPWSCIAGRICMGILYDGALSACAHIDRAFIQGNVRKDNIREAWENRYQIFRERPKQEICKNCSQKKICTLPMHKLGSSGRIRECVFNLIKKGGE